VCVCSLASSYAQHLHVFLPSSAAAGTAAGVTAACCPLLTICSAPANSENLPSPKNQQQSCRQQSCRQQSAIPEKASVVVPTAKRQQSRWKPVVPNKGSSSCADSLLSPRGVRVAVSQAQAAQAHTRVIPHEMSTGCVSD